MSARTDIEFGEASELAGGKKIPSLDRTGRLLTVEVDR